MLPVIIGMVVALAAVDQIDKLLKTSKTLNPMANCHSLFTTFHDEISITASKRTRLKDSKEKLRERIRKHFALHHPTYEPRFFIQGSYKMKTIIRTVEDICDLDDGVYFFREPDVTSTTLQGWVWDAANGHTSTAPQHRKKCIRNIFASDYEIDMPVYYKVDGSQYKLAIKNEGWRNDDPKAMVVWFNKRTDKEQKLLRAVKYLKAWCDFEKCKPSGLAMTILAANTKENLILGERDDINLKDILKEIKKELNSAFKCVVPVDPSDDLFVDYDDEAQKKFLNSLNAFIEDADDALKEKNQLAASKLWRKHLGEKFPLGEDQDEDQSMNKRLITGIGLSSPYGSK